MERVGIALIGCGLIGRQHATALREILDRSLVDSSRVKLVAACDVQLERAEAAVRDFQFQQAFDNPVQAIEHPDVTVVYVCTPTIDHAELVHAAASRGKALFCEKPLAHTAREAESMLEVVRKHNVPHQVGLVLRYSPIFTELKALLAGADPSTQGMKPMGMIFRDDQCLPVDGYYKSQWRGDVAIAGGGTLIEHSIHDIDVIRWFFGEPVSVYAKLSYFSEYPGIEDCAAVLFSFASGLSVNLLSVWHKIAPRRSERRVEMFLDRGWLSSIGDFSGNIDVQIGERPIVSIDNASLLERYRQRLSIEDGHPDSVCDGYLQESLAFIKALLSGKTLSPDLSEAVKAHRIVDAIYESAKSGAPVLLESAKLAASSIG